MGECHPGEPRWVLGTWDLCQRVTLAPRGPHPRPSHPPPFPPQLERLRRQQQLQQTGGGNGAAVQHPPCLRPASRPALSPHRSPTQPPPPRSSRPAHPRRLRHRCRWHDVGARPELPCGPGPRGATVEREIKGLSACFAPGLCLLFVPPPREWHPPKPRRLPQPLEKAP